MTIRQMLIGAAAEAPGGSPSYPSPIDLEGTYTDTVQYPYGGTAVTTLTIKTNGEITVSRNVASTTVTGNWYTPTTAGVGTGKYVRCTVNSGSLSGGSSATGSWLQINTNRSWNCQRGSTPAEFGTSEANITIEVSEDSGGSPVQNSGTYTIKAVNPYS